MKYKVIITETAKKDLRDISFWIAYRSKNIDIAKKFINELREAIRKLSIFPRSGSIPEDSIIKSSGFRFIVHKNYLIFYSIEESEKTVRIMAVFNSRQDYMRVIAKFI